MVSWHTSYKFWFCWFWLSFLTKVTSTINNHLKVNQKKILFQYKIGMMIRENRRRLNCWGGRAGRGEYGRRFGCGSDWRGEIGTVGKIGTGRYGWGGLEWSVASRETWWASSLSGKLKSTRLEHSTITVTPKWSKCLSTLASLTIKSKQWGTKPQQRCLIESSTNWKPGWQCWTKRRPFFPNQSSKKEANFKNISTVKRSSDKCGPF